MSRGQEASFVEAIDNESVRIVMFVSIALATGTVYLHTDIGTITWGGNDWIGVGDFGGISTMKEGEEIAPYELTLLLSGVDADLAEAARDAEFYRREVEIYVAARDVDTGDLTAAPTKPLWGGFVDTARMSLGSTNTIELVCENELASFEKVAGNMFSNADIREDFAGDTFFSFLESMTDKRVVWRGENATTGTRVSLGGGVTKFA